MGSHGVDLVYEMQGELNWDKEFASLACKEYSKWLELRAKTGDFQFCKLPPSRVVAMVWNLHRQWTLDYEKTCAALGGFIHHFPPAMRLSFSREQGYALTLQTYKSHFGEDPPASYWEPPICPSRPDVSPTGLLTQNIEQSDDIQLSLVASALQQCNVARESDVSRIPTTNTGVQKKGGFPRLRRRNAASSQRTASVVVGKQALQQESNREIPTERTVLSDSSEPLSIAHDTFMTNDANATQRHEEPRVKRKQGDAIENEAKVMKTPRGGRKVQEGFVLRPLAPGEKRKRGRPSMSDYVPVSQLSDTHGDTEKTTPQAKRSGGEQNETVGSSPSRSKSASIMTEKGKKGRSTKVHLRVQTLRPSQTADDNNVEYSGSTKHSFPASEGKRKTATTARADTTRRKNVEAGNKQQLSASVRIGPDGSILRRPPGRPRKDGSWPVPRAKRPHVSQSTQRRKSNSDLLPTSQTTPDASAKQEGYFPTAIVTDADIEAGDYHIPELGAGVSQQIIDSGDTESNEVQLQMASERESDPIL